LRILAEKPGLTGQDLAKELNVSATAANRHIAMLANKGVIEQVSGTDRGHGYAIKDERREHVEKAMELLRPKEG
jgi:predicted ArsR family transcriptional regulator